MKRKLKAKFSHNQGNNILAQLPFTTRESEVVPQVAK